MKRKFHIFSSTTLFSIIFLLLPFSRGILQIEIGIITFNPYTLGILAFFVIALLRIALGKARYPVKPEDVAIVLLSASFLLSTVKSADPVDAGFLAFHGIFIPVITYFVVKTTIASDTQYQQLLVFLASGIVAFAVLTIYTYTASPSRAQIMDQSSISMAGMFFCALVIIFSSRWHRHWLGKLAILVLLPALFLTYARGYLVLTLVSPVVFHFMRKGKGLVLIIGLLLSSLIGTLLLAFSAADAPPDALKGERNLRDEQTLDRVTDPKQWLNSLYGRGVYYYEGIQEFKKSPIIGNGFHQGTNRTGVRAVVWHNYHIEWLEYGGMLSYLFYFVTIVSHYRSVARHAKRDRYIAANLTIVFLLLVNGLTNSFTAGITPYLGFLFMGLSHARLKFPQSIQIKR